MDKTVKVILFVIVALLVVNFLLTFFGNSSISSIRDNLRSAKLSADSALNQIKYSKSKLDSIKNDMANFQSRISNINQTVSTMDQVKSIQDQKDVVRLTDLKKAIGVLKPELEPLNLPDIDIRNLEK
jgi:predicted  nucleic acid-binding Zn-ribbon protein